jgi:hypothetical protein
MTLQTVRIDPASLPDATAVAGEGALAVVGDAATIDLVAGLLDLVGSSTLTDSDRALTLLIEIKRRGALDAELVERLMPAAIPTPAHVLQLQRNAALRAAALAEFGTWTAADIASVRGIETVNEHATPGRWLKERRVFAVDGPRERRFPVFQFSADAHPLPAMRAVLGALPDTLSGWETLLWFTAPNGWLDGARPVDLVAAAPERVTRAAGQLTASLDD